MSARERIFEEIKETEAKYIQGLTILSNTYLKPLQTLKAFKCTSGFNKVVSTLAIIQSTNQQLFSDLQNATVDTIGSVFVRLVPFLITYANYFNSYEKASNDIRSQKRETKKFAEWLDLTEKQSKANGQLGLNDYLITPVQRVPRYVLFLKELVSKTDSTHPDYEKLLKCLEETKRVANNLNASLDKMEATYKFEKLEKNLMSNKFETVKIIEPHRRYMCDIDVTVPGSQLDQGSADTHRYLFLLSDLILICRKATDADKRQFQQNQPTATKGRSRSKSFVIGRSSASKTDLPDGTSGPKYIMLEEISLSQVPVVALNSFPGESAKSITARALQISTQNKTRTYFANDSTKRDLWCQKFNEAMDNIVAGNVFDIADKPVAKHIDYPLELFEYCVSIIQRQIQSHFAAQDMKLKSVEIGKQEAKSEDTNAEPSTDSEEVMKSHFLTARNHDVLQNKKKAIEYYTKAIEAGVLLNNGGANLNIAPFFLYRASACDSIDAYTQAIKDYSEFIERYKPYCSSQMDDSSITQFISLYTAYHNRGYVYSTIGEDEKAKESFECAVRELEKLSNPDEAIKYNSVILDTYYQSGKCRENDNDIHGAIKDYSYVLKYQPDHKCRFLRANLNFSSGNHDQALEDFAVAIQNDGSNWQAYYNRGLSYKLLKQYEKAIADFRMTLELNSQFIRGYIDLGRTTQLTGTTESQEIAREVYTNGIDVYLQSEDQSKYSSDAATLYFERALISIESNSGNEEEAVADLTKSIAIRPHESSYYHRGYLYHHRIQDYNKALEDYSKAIEQCPNDVDFLNSRGYVLVKLNREADALIEFQKVLAIDPTNTTAKRGHDYCQQ